MTKFEKIMRKIDNFFDNTIVGNIFGIAFILFMGWVFTIIMFSF